MDGLPGDVARGSRAEEHDHAGDVLRPAALASDRRVRQMMLRLRRVLWARRADEPRHDAIHGDAALREIVRHRPGETHEARLRAHHMRAVFRAGMGAHTADVDY